VILTKTGGVSAEESSPYTAEWTDKFHDGFWNSEYPVHLQMYSGIPGKLKITEIK
jgi:hypothetical protein